MIPTDTMRAATGRSLAGAVCVCVKYVVLYITLDRTCTDTLNQPRARLARLGRLHWISVYTLTKENPGTSRTDSYVQMCACNLCAPKIPRLWVYLAGRNRVGNPGMPSARTHYPSMYPCVVV